MKQERYSRQILYKGIGQSGQQKINQKTVLIVGMGALGTHLAEGLIRAGIGKLILVDRDYIEHSNLQRQTLFTEHDADQRIPKVVAARQMLQAIRRDAVIEIYIEHVDAAFLEQHVPYVDLIMDATDNFETRMRLNDAAYRYRVPWIYGGVVQSTYVSAPFIPGKTPCFQCLVPQIPALNLTCDTVGVIQPAVTMTTSFQLRDGLKILTDTTIDAKLTYGDIWEGTHFTFGMGRLQREDCATCGTQPYYPYLNERTSGFAVLCGRDTVQYQHPDLSYTELKSFLDSRGIRYHMNDYLLQFKFEKYRIVAFQEGRLLIHGLKDAAQAQVLIRKLFG
ncbi:ThiF family adenylyltransferase [Staphylococcus lutrae]|uniref:Molybdopterin biosynthesis protein MoeB n=1 Tax=Staphylococcus lutrae TaxID=155085 RepID=A0AAC9RQM2_9STAP|nr:ThiF family adenylyltransferase [Staphylococcus lutrae]ARJ50428.1 molybdopterin biosynthesis protein MoeB [Staphylococcus lutrae]PNZ38774.1 molybdopterin biosynthesis protein MoeB [Staphylococcus lutrae]